MSVVLPPPHPTGAGGPCLNTFPSHPSPGSISRSTVQKQLLDNLTAELDRQAAQRRSYRLPRDVVDVGTRPETDDMEWILTEKLKLQRMTANLRRHATCHNEQEAVAKFDRHVNSLATEFRTRYATEHLRQNRQHRQPADHRRSIQARYSANPPLFAGTTSRTSERTITSPLGGARSGGVNVSPVAPITTVPAGGSIIKDTAWDKVIRPAGPCISRLQTQPGPSSMSRGNSGPTTMWHSARSDVSMSRSASNRSKADPTLESDISLVDNELESDVPHYVQDLIDDSLDCDCDNFSDVSSEADLMQVDAQHIDQALDVDQAAHHQLSYSAVDAKVPVPEMPPALAFARETVTINEASVRAMCYWLAIHVVGRLAYPEPARRDVEESADQWDMGSVVDRSAKRMSGASNFEPTWITSPRPSTPIRPHRVYGKIPSDPYKVLNIHGAGPVIKPDPQFVNFLVHLIYEKELAIETIVAAAWFIDGVSVHEVDGEFGKELRQLLSFSNPGESFAAERRLVLIGLYLADMCVSDNHWALSAWADACMVPRPQARLMERHALSSLRHFVSIAPKAWLDHCSNLYSNVARLRIEDAGINWTLLEVCHKMVTTARGIVNSNAEYDSYWTAAHRRLSFDRDSVDTSRMAADKENVPPCADDDDEYEEFDGAGNFPQPVFIEASPIKLVQPEAHQPVSAPALKAALVAVAQAPDSDREPLAPVFDYDDDDFEPYDGAGHFPMPVINGRNTTRVEDYHHHNPSHLRHPRAVPRSPVQLARVRPVLNRFETLAALMTDAPYRFPTPRKSISQTPTTNNTNQVQFHPGSAPGGPLSVVIPPYPAQQNAEPLSVPPNSAWPSTNPMNMTYAAQPLSARPPLARLSPVTAHPGRIFPNKAALRPREGNVLARRYRHPGYFRERYAPPPTPVQPGGQFDPFAASSGPADHAVKSGMNVPALEPRGMNPLFSPSSEGGTPNTPTGHVQVWRPNQVAPSCERLPSPTVMVSTTCDQNPWY